MHCTALCRTLPLLQVTHPYYRDHHAWWWGADYDGGFGIPYGRNEKQRVDPELTPWHYGMEDEAQIYLERVDLLCD